MRRKSLGNRAMASAPASGRTNWSGESKNLWLVAGPVILASVFQFLIAFVTAAFVGHIGKVELAAVSIVNGVIEGLAFGLLLGMGSALETLCGQAVGAGQLQMLGVYMQRSWIICLATSLALLPLYIFTSPILRLLRQSSAISAVSGRYARWCVPQLFAYAVNFPIQKFFQAQSRVWVMTAISGAVLAAHALLNWVVVAKLGRGMLGAALVGDASWWLLNAAQFVYLVGGSFPEAWTGFSRKAFASLGGFVKLSVASAVMLWFVSESLAAASSLSSVVIRASKIIDASLHELSALDADGCAWLQCCSKLFLSFSFLVSVRVSNELGANHPKAAKFSVVVATTTSAAIGLIFTAVALAARKQMPRLFTGDGAVIKETAKLGYLLAATIFLNSIQPVLSGVAIGAGWQSLVAFVNIGCYYLVGLPLAAVFGFKLKLNATVRHAWKTRGDLGGRVDWNGVTDCDSVCDPHQNQMAERGKYSTSSFILFFFFFCRLLNLDPLKHSKQAMLAEERIRVWGGKVELPRNQETGASENIAGPV
ncbi:hypothetical protein HU200_055140 [Digitaria exilis]|uniref:Protein DETOXIFICATION n=1 Tax=Digitaria exilis TaxID=1010633 RepID=A0A835AJH8_9POAL|nr:hypothetical protein HU200_055140 [Digitaria exilis]